MRSPNIDVITSSNISSFFVSELVARVRGGTLLSFSSCIDSRFMRHIKHYEGLILYTPPLDYNSFVVTLKLWVKFFSEQVDYCKMSDEYLTKEIKVLGKVIFFKFNDQMKDYKCRHIDLKFWIRCSSGNTKNCLPKSGVRYHRGTYRLAAYFNTSRGGQQGDQQVSKS